MIIQSNITVTKRELDDNILRFGSEYVSEHFRNEMKKHLIDLLPLRAEFKEEGSLFGLHENGMLVLQERFAVYSIEDIKEVLDTIESMVFIDKNKKERIKLILTKSTI